MKFIPGGYSQGLGVSNCNIRKNIVSVSKVQFGPSLTIHHYICYNGPTILGPRGYHGWSALFGRETKYAWGASLGGPRIWKLSNIWYLFTPTKVDLVWPTSLGIHLIIVEAQLKYEFRGVLCKIVMWAGHYNRAFDKEKLTQDVYHCSLEGIVYCQAIRKMVKSFEQLLWKCLFL